MQPASTLPTSQQTKETRSLGPQLRLENPLLNDPNQAHWHGLLPWLDAEGGLYALDARMQAAARQARVALQAQELAVHAALGRLDQALKQAGLLGLLVKGEALAHTHYPRATRSRTDIDLLVALNQFEPARAAIESAGWKRETNAFGTWSLPEQRLLDPGGVVVIDLHARLFSRPALALALPFEDLLPRSVPLAECAALRVPSDADQLLIAALHRVAHHVHERNRAIWLLDFALLVRSAPALNEARARANRLGIGGLLEDALRAAHALWASAELSDAVQTAPTNQFEPLSTYLQPMSRLAMLRLDLNMLPRWIDRLAFLKELAFPPANYVAGENQDRQGIQLRLAYLKRAWRGLRRWSRSSR